jgi:hypothetical protein
LCFFEYEKAFSPQKTDSAGQEMLVSNGAPPWLDHPNQFGYWKKAFTY